jgi:hypothetical protein
LRNGALVGVSRVASRGQRFLARDGGGVPGTILLADNFSDPSNGALPTTSPQPEKTQVGYVSGEYQLSVVDPSYALGAFVYAPGTYTDTTIDLDVRMLPQNKPQAGFFLRSRYAFTPPRGVAGYSFGLYPLQGAFSLGRWEPSPDSTTSYLINLLGGGAVQYSSAVKQGTAENHIQLSSDGDLLTATINGTLVASIRDETFQSGRIQFATGFGTGGRLDISGPIDVRLANLIITGL